MENGKIYIKEGIIFLFNKKMYLGMSYLELKNDFAEYIVFDISFNDMEGEKCICVKLKKTKVYDVYCEVKAYFRKEKIYQFILSADANDTEVDSPHTGLRLYQDKVMQTVTELRRSIEKQYHFTDSNKENLFMCIENGNRLFSAVDRDCMECCLVFDSM